MLDWTKAKLYPPKARPKLSQLDFERWKSKGKLGETQSWDGVIGLGPPSPNAANYRLLANPNTQNK